MTYIPQPVKTEAGIMKSVVSDDNAQSLLGQILAQLTIMNAYLAFMTDEEIGSEEVEDQ